MNDGVKDAKCVDLRSNASVAGWRGRH
jgi:hypothetical protein